MRKFAFAAAAALLCISSAAQSSITVKIVQSGSDVVATTSGSLDLTGSTFACECGANPYIWGAYGYFHVGNAMGYVYDSLTGSATFGPGDLAYASTSTGDVFGLASGSNFEVPIGYTSGSDINNTTTWNNQTLASLGLTSGVYAYSLPNDTITVDIGDVGSVPEPATWAMMLLGFAGIGFAMRNRPKVRSAVRDLA